jgi:hypothetical protein
MENNILTLKLKVKLMERPMHVYVSRNVLRYLSARITFIPERRPFTAGYGEGGNSAYCQ